MKVSLAFNVPSHQAESRKSARGGWKTEKLSSYQELIGWEAVKASKGQPIIEGNFKAIIKFGLKGKRHGDLDNMEKSTFDALEGIVFRNDKSLCHKESFYTYCDPPYVEIWIDETILV